MGNNANRIVAMVAAFLIAAILLLVIGAGACSPRGGGGGGVVSSPVREDNAENASNADTAATLSPDGNGNSPSIPDETMTLEQVKEELSQSTAPVGENVRVASTSPDTPTAADVSVVNRQRGFDDVELTASFAMDGTYRSNDDVDSASTERYPSYTFFYPSAQKVLWVVYINEGKYYAAPLGSSQETLQKQVLFSESDEVVQYDGLKNEFSDFSLDEIADVLTVRVDAIDAHTLDGYSLEMLKAM